jgi:hypothetical protein
MQCSLLLQILGCGIDFETPARICRIQSHTRAGHVDPSKRRRPDHVAALRNLLQEIAINLIREPADRCGSCERLRFSRERQGATAVTCSELDTSRHALWLDIENFTLRGADPG